MSELAPWAEPNVSDFRHKCVSDKVNITILFTAHRFHFPKLRYRCIWFKKSFFLIFKMRIKILFLKNTLNPPPSNPWLRANFWRRGGGFKWIERYMFPVFVPAYYRVIQKTGGRGECAFMIFQSMRSEVRACTASQERGKRGWSAFWSVRSEVGVCAARSQRAQ